jgi:hypothetical protein
LCEPFHAQQRRIESTLHFRKSLNWIAALFRRFLSKQSILTSRIVSDINAGLIRDQHTHEASIILESMRWDWPATVLLGKAREYVGI